MGFWGTVHVVTPGWLEPSVKRVQASRVGTRFLRGAFWALLGTITARSLGLASTILVARFLGTESYGALAIIVSTTGMFQVFAGFGLGLTATKHIAEFRIKQPEKAGRIMSLSALVAIVTGVICTVALFLFAPWLAKATLAAPDLAPLLQIGSIMLLLGAMNGAQMGALAGFEAFRAIAWVSLVAGLASFPMMVGGVLWLGLEGAVWGSVATLALNWLLNHLALRREASRAGVPFRLRGVWSEWRILWSYSLPVFLSGAMVGPAQWACAAFLVNQPGGYSSMGEFNAANAIRMAIVTFCASMAQPLAPMLSSMVGKESHFFASFNILFTWALGIACAGIIISIPEIPEALFGSGFAGETFRGAVVISMLVTAIYLYKDGLARVLMARGLMWWGFLDNLFWAVALIGSSFFLVQWGAVGLAASYAIAYAVNTLVIVPLYLRWGLAPRGTLISWEAFAIWSSVFMLAWLAIFDASLSSRMIALSCALAVDGWALWRLIRRPAPDTPRTL